MQRQTITAGHIVATSCQFMELSPDGKNTTLTVFMTFAIAGVRLRRSSAKLANQSMQIIDKANTGAKLCFTTTAQMEHKKHCRISFT